jgi:hypothetical protein
VQGGVYLLYLHSFAFKYRYILYNLSHHTPISLAALSAAATAAHAAGQRLTSTWHFYHSQVSHLQLSDWL